MHAPALSRTHTRTHTHTRTRPHTHTRTHTRTHSMHTHMRTTPTCNARAHSQAQEGTMWTVGVDSPDIDVSGSSPIGRALFQALRAQQASSVARALGLRGKVRGAHVR